MMRTAQKAMPIKAPAYSSAVGPLTFSFLLSFISFGV